MEAETRGKSNNTGILDPESWLHSILTFLDPKLERSFYQMIYLNAKCIRNKSVSEGKHLQVLRKHLAPAVDNTSMGEIIAVKLHHHHQPNLQGQQLKGREVSLFCFAVRKEGKLVCNMSISSTYSGRMIQNISPLPHLFKVISVQRGTHRTNLVTSRAEELAVLNHNINLKKLTTKHFNTKVIIIILYNTSLICK